MPARDQHVGSLTLSDIARLAGVSRSAASRALDRHAPSNSAGAKRVRAVAAEHGYVPNAWAANLRRQRSGLIGVVVPRLTDTIMAMLYEALVVECDGRGLRATVVTTADDPRRELELGRSLVAQRVDGLILTTARADGADPLLVELRRQGVPHSLALRSDGVSPAAVVDDRAGGALATDHLIGRGHRRIAFVGGPRYASSSRSRERGYGDALNRAGIDVSPELVLESNFSMEAGADAGRRLLALAEPPTAVFTANDSLAVGLLAVAQRRGLRVPEELSVVGYSDTPLASNLAVPLTSIRVDFDSIARDAMDLLEHGQALEPGMVRMTVPRLIERSSVSPRR